MLISEIAEKKENGVQYQEIFKIIGNKEKVSNGVNDGFESHTADEINTIKQLQYEIVHNNRVLSGESLLTKSEYDRKITNIKDGFYNPITPGSTTDSRQGLLYSISCP